MRLCRWPGDSSYARGPSLRERSASNVLGPLDLRFSQRELTVLMAIAYFQRLRGPTYHHPGQSISAMSSRILQKAAMLQRGIAAPCLVRPTAM